MPPPPLLFSEATLRRWFASSATASATASDSSRASSRPVNDSEGTDSETASSQRPSGPAAAAGAEQASSTQTTDGGAGGAAGNDSAGGDSSDAATNQSGGPFSAAPPPASGRHALLGGLIVLAALGGAAWVVYDRGWVSDYMANSLLSDLATNGPSTVVDLNGPGDKWQLIHVNATLRRKCAEPQHIGRLLEGIVPTEHIVEVQRMCLVILSELAHDRQNNTRPHTRRIEPASTHGSISPPQHPSLCRCACPARAAVITCIAQPLPSRSWLSIQVCRRLC